jgi:hypothetical protein
MTLSFWFLWLAMLFVINTLMVWSSYKRTKRFQAHSDKLNRMVDALYACTTFDELQEARDEIARVAREERPE